MTTWESQLQDYSYKLFFCVHGTVHPYNIVLVNNQREAAFVLLGLLSLHSNIIVTRKDVLIWCHSVTVRLVYIQISPGHI